MSAQVLQSGESRQCVNIYSYADPYDVTVLAYSEKNLNNNYLLTVEE